MDRTRVAVSAGFLLQGFTFAALVTQTPRLQDRFDLGEGDVTVLLVGAVSYTHLRAHETDSAACSRVSWPLDARAGRP
ncbi:hypothetical protein [uncultured Aeromicrobium sp.]|uniref:hypothetical protein n=1 Tax=uncultured Aeromicrobium sp. TaxID=337820 RepID=UPI002593FF52|nr:hypothetical protein [uncultured Aeromicrobium sp.]